MKKIITEKIISSILISGICISSLCACGASGGSDKYQFGEFPSDSVGIQYSMARLESLTMENDGYLPTLITDIENGGSVSSECQPKCSTEPSAFPIQSMRGYWTLEDGQADVEATTIPYAIQSESGTRTGDINVFPVSLGFYEWFFSEFDDLYKEDSILFKQDGVTISDLVKSNQITLIEPDTSSATQLGKALFNQGIMGLGESGTSAHSSLATFGSTQLFAYSLSGNKLALGFLDVGDLSTDISETNIIELDYDMDLSGETLNLTYNGQTAKYKRNSSSDYLRAGVILEKNAIDGILGIDYSGHEYKSIMTSLHDGYVPADIQIDDKTITINGKTYDYIRSDEVLTLCADGNVGIYSTSALVSGALGNLIYAGLWFGEQNQLLKGKTDLSFLYQFGCTTSEDLSKQLLSHAVSDELKFTYDGVEFGVILTNIKSYEMPLSECYISGIRLYETSDKISVGGSAFLGRDYKSMSPIIGTSTMEELSYFYKTPYEMKPKYLRYETIGEAFDFSSMLFSDRFDPEMPATNEFYIIFKFDDNGILSEIDIDEPSLLYSSLDSNMDYETVSNMSPDQISIVVAKRDGILTQLKTAFEDAGITVNIDEESGTITMDNSILFAVDSTELSTEGKEYIDSFMSVYASVVLDGENSNVISSVQYEGHTDSTGGYDYNMDLSKRRAEAVMNYCVTDSNLEADQKNKLKGIAEANGYGYTMPVLDDNGSEDQAASRRVAIKFYVKSN